MMLEGHRYQNSKYGTSMFSIVGHRTIHNSNWFSGGSANRININATSFQEINSNFKRGLKNINLNNTDGFV